MPDPRDYSSISPSAKSLLLMKGLTSIPYAREAAGLIMHPESYEADFSNTSAAFWSRVVHFEHRYWCIDQLLSDLPAKNILELSSGFSFRGLALSRQREVFYIDTDLPEIITAKKEMVKTLVKDMESSVGILELSALNALDENEFEAIANRFPQGEIIIVNEGLLMYLGMPEKESLCRIIHDLLRRRGGYWITADIYIRKKFNAPELEKKDTLQQFFDRHHIEDNKFNDFTEAEAFFNRMGFVLEREAETGYENLSTASYFRASASPELITKMRKTGRIHATWRLRVAENS